jgi:UDP-glucose 4-epimerase
MNIAITGANGVVGRAVADRALAAGHSVVPIDRSFGMTPTDRTVELDVTDYPALLEGLDGCDALIHLAAIPGPGRHPDAVVHGNNVVASYNALRAAAEVGIERVCQASSVNAIGGRFSLRPRYDYFPVDERHACYAEDPYSLSKWICEEQADAIGRRYGSMTIASLRFHGVVESRTEAIVWSEHPDGFVDRQLWGYTNRAAAARACLLAVTADFSGHERLYIVAPDTMVDTPSLELRERHYPDVPVQGNLSGNNGFFDCSRAALVLGWNHDDD